MGGLACSGPRWGGAAGTLQAVSAVTLGVPGVPESTHMPSAWILKRGPLPTVRKKSRGHKPDIRGIKLLMYFCTTTSLRK